MLANEQGVKLGIVDLAARTWHLPDTKNQRSHTIHLSTFALAQLDNLRPLRESTPWLFPATDKAKPVCVKSFGKQLADRQRDPDARLQNRSKATTTLLLPGGKWTAHDLRRTAGTIMAGLGISGDVIDWCLNHMIESRVGRTYIRDRRPAEQARAFEALGASAGANHQRPQGCVERGPDAGQRIGMSGRDGSHVAAAVVDSTCDIRCSRNSREIAERRIPNPDGGLMFKLADALLYLFCRRRFSDPLIDRQSD